MKTLAVPAETTTREETTGFWSRLLDDESMKCLSNLERLVAGCEIIAALDDLNLLEPTTR
ncbi:MAG TPA: hypothetical protein VGC85_04005 [Chthoniobacterales bacterium]